jgi:uracil-DNA glycosylase family 4
MAGDKLLAARYIDVMFSYDPPSLDCPLCLRLCAFREANRQSFKHFFNAPVPSFGELNARLLVVGLAPGLRGANATGRPFTGDYAGDILYAALQKAGLAQGDYQKRADDGFQLINTRITNAVRCVPPENKPEPSEIKTCNGFLKDEIAAMPEMRVILTLGNIAHAAVLKALGYKAAHAKFAHGAEHGLGRVTLINSYHTSRYNMNTRRLTVEMFDGVVGQALTKLSAG